MKLYVSLIFTAVMMAFASGYFVLFVKGSYQVTDSDLIKINRLKGAFTKHYKVQTNIDFSILFPTTDHLKLITPIYNLAEFNPSQIPLFSTNKDCFVNISKEIISSRRLKELIWEEFRCKKRNYLPQNFFRRPPYLHRSGFSYVYLAYASGRKGFRRESWIKSNINLFHVLELNKLDDTEGWIEILSTLDNQNLESLGKGEIVIMTDRYLLVKSQKSRYSPLIQFFGSSVVKYQAYHRSDFEQFLRETAYTIKTHRRGQECFYKDGQICWEYNIGHLFRLANKTNILLFSISLLVIVLVVWLLLNRIRMQRREEERKRLALQVLTHEFRTPIASMLIQMEVLNNKYSQLDPDVQELVLRLSSDVYRLQRLTESSRNYLRLQNKKQLIQLNKEMICSINDFFEEQLADHEGVAFFPLQSDRMMFVDPYWLGIGIKNIIENASAHGKPPIEVRLKLIDDNLMIEISDCGDCEFDLLEKMSGEFVKGSHSHGTGLGLNIVRKIVDSFDGELKFIKAPTTFVLNFPIGGILEK